MLNRDHHSFPAKTCDKTLLSFPIEILEIIIQEAWWAVRQTFSRWRLYKKLCLVSKSWHAMATEAVLLSVFIERERDVRMYTIFVKQYLTSQGHHLGDTYHRDLFCRGRTSISISSHKLPDQTLADLAKLIPDARSMDLAIHCRVSDLLVDRHSLKYLRLCWDVIDNSVINPQPSVTHLHISRCPPRLSCTPNVVQFLNRFLTYFPNVTHLRLSTACFLKDIISRTQKLEHLTIDVPPKIIGGQDYSSLSWWNITSGLNKGLLKQGVTSGQRKIVVNAGVNLSGWGQASSACAAHGVQLERRLHYDRPLKQDRFYHSPGDDPWGHEGWI